MNLPADENILLSLINTKLRDNYRSLEELCEEEGVELSELSSRMDACGYYYDPARNCFAAKNQ